MRRPVISGSVLRGIIAATGQVLAGPEEGECEDDWADIERANDWAHRMCKWLDDQAKNRREVKK